MKTTCKCDECNGTGEIVTEVCISEWAPPTHHEKSADLENIVEDARRAKRDHAKLCELNPRAKESYDAQLSATLAKLDQEARELL